MKSRGMLIVFSGPAGTGKGTVCKEFLKRNPDSVLSVSATTRLPRPGETDGREYFFVSREEFEETIKKDGFLEYACFCDNYYGTPKKAVDEKLENGFNVILEIEVQGAMQIKEKVPEAVFVFISPPSKKVLRERIEGRGTETPEVINKRMTLAENELKQIVNYDYLIVNDEVEKAVKSFEDIVNAERLKTSRNLNFIQEVCK
ncbi:MAG: guanylate kinase [Ruminococcaceae bacterium]|nr:guanylate kinase [Oscillospiraceae bacterium]